MTSVPHPELYITPRELNAAGELIRETTGFTPYYFSIVTFTTLGFGDVIPLNLAGEVWLAIEVVLGYVMLGGLISIFANKLAKIGRGFKLNRVGFGYMAAAWSLIDRGEK